MGTHYIWDDSMVMLLGQIVEIVHVPEPGFFGLPECIPDSGQPIWWYPENIIERYV